MNRNKYNNRLKEDMLGYQSSVNVDAIWANIEPKVDVINARNNTRRGFYRLCAVGIVLLGTALYLFPFSQSHVGEEIALSNPSGKEEVAKNASDELSVSSALSAQNNNIPALPEASIAAADSKTDSPSNTLTTSAEGINSTLQPSQTQSASNLILPQPEKITSSSITPPAPIATEEKGGQENQKIPLLEVKEKNSIALENSGNLPLANENKEDQLTSLSKGFSMIPPRSILASPLSSRTIATDDLSSYTPNYGLGRQDFTYSIMLQAGIASTGRKLEGVIDTTGNRLLQNRLNSETPLENIQVGLLAGVHHHTGFNVMAGLQYTRITERFENTVTVESVDSIEGIIKLIVLPNGDTIPERGLIPVVTTTTTRKRYYNRYNLIDVPFLLGYEKQINNLRLGLQAGVFANISLTTEGRIFDEESVLVDIGVEQNNVFKKNVGLSYYFSFSVGYEMASGITLHFAPYLHHYPGRFTSDDYLLTQKYSLLGIKAGVQYKF